MHLGICRRRDNSPLLHLHDVPAEFIVDRCLRDLPRLQCEGDFGKLRPDLVTTEEAQVAAVLAIRILAVLLRQARKIRSLVEFGNEVLRFVLVLTRIWRARTSSAAGLPTYCLVYWAWIASSLACGVATRLSNAPSRMRSDASWISRRTTGSLSRCSRSANCTSA